MIELTTSEIDYAAVTESVRDNRAGAVVLFLGTVREFTGDVRTASLEYEAYGEMACVAIKQLVDDARVQWPVTAASIIHRTGPLELGDIAVAVAVSSPHRQDAFAAGQWLMDTLKQTVPIWKKELYADGSTEWVHPGTATQAQPPAKDDQ